MLSKPNVLEMVPKVGNRYEISIAVAKRARQIEKKRFETGDRNIRDSVDIATEEIYEGKVNVMKNGKYVLESKQNENEEVKQNDAVIQDTLPVDDKNIIEEKKDEAVLIEDKDTKKVKSKRKVKETKDKEESNGSNK